MKWKVTRLYIASLLGLVIFILLVQFFFVSYFANTYNHEGVDDPEKWAFDFQKEIMLKTEGITITDKGKNFLKEHGAWLQVLDCNGNEVFQLYKPKHTPVHYTPSDMILRYKYDVNNYTTFVSKLENGGEGESYIIAFPSNQALRKFFYFNFSNLSSIYPYGFLMLMGAAAVCICIFAYFVAKYMSKPVLKIIEHIKKLKQGKYGQVQQETGVYAEVYANLNQLSSQLKNVDRQREKLDTMRAEWITNISHDLKTPLSSIKGYSEIIGNRDYKIGEEEIRQYAEVIQNKSIYIEKLIDDLKLTYQLKNALLPIQKIKVDIVELVRETIIEFMNMPHYENRTIEFQCADDELFLKVDQKLMQRVLANILINALVHNVHGTIIRVSVKQISQNCVIIIEDNGKGIVAGELIYIFDRYYRGTNTESETGSGLGMAIAKDIIVAHGGEITVDSTEGKGTKFNIQLPLED
ncbi:sensor histidine kinase [Bacillus sp. NPDC094106]|uniref:sensor histidine kinase n=1 Tax=Bacillus sp. NPDC094106 TaxID=3363949 RepID=UPI003810E0D3